jgi:AAA+ superfamily predicted ATPase
MRKGLMNLRQGIIKQAAFGSQKQGARSGNVEAQGILDGRTLPDSEFAAQWDSIIIGENLKDRLLAQAVLNFTMRPKVDRATLPLHGIIVLVGPPGTGKTSLARGLASRTADALKSLGSFLYLEVEPHALASAALGRSQKAVRDLLGSTIAEQASGGPLIVLLDEVETLASDRSKLSLEANPVDVHRATDAMLAQLDQLAAQFPNLLFIATSNFAEAIDAAFLSRADLIITIDKPGPEACRRILASTVESLAAVFPALKKVTSHPDFESAAAECCGLDGRAIRKLVLTACTFDKQTALDPSRLTASDILKAARHAKQERAALKGASR